LPSNVPVEIAKYKALDLDPITYQQVMAGTAEVFDLSAVSDHVRVAP
jgi:hypothetical protein